MILSLNKVDRLLISNFVGPFVVTFFIAVFVLDMQMLWLYIDEIAGKGVGFFLLAELVGYMSVSMFPTALPIAVLISSVMVLGNLAEHYELSSFKSAGVPLIRIMWGLLLMTFLISLFSFFSSNNFIPVSNLKFRSRLYDIRKQKPTLNLEEGVFNDDFQGYSIRIGEKDKDNRGIRNVLIIDHSKANDGLLLEITAKSGEMYVTGDERYFVMNLNDGWQYQEMKNDRKKDQNYPFMRTAFKEWTKIFDLSEFELSRTDEDLFGSHHAMLTSGQLVVAIDSIDNAIANRVGNLHDNTLRYFQLFKSKEEKDTVDTSQEMVRDSIKKEPDEEKLASNEGKKSNPEKPSSKGRLKPMKQYHLEKLDSLGMVAFTFPKNKQAELFSKSKQYARAILNQSESASKSVLRKLDTRVDHVFELHSKFSMALACIIFLFIGAPMGAIVRKGGFGYPILISIFFFMFFIILTIMSKNIAERFVIDPGLAAWVPCLVFIPIGGMLTYSAMNDHKQLVGPKMRRFFNFISAPIILFLSRFRKKKAEN
jgi:lipopolysaccharide export system permease protein